MSIAASSVECDDLRLSYSGVMSQIEIVPDGSMTLNSSQDRSPVRPGQAKSSTSTAGKADLQGLCLYIDDCGRQSPVWSVRIWFLL